MLLLFGCFTISQKYLKYLFLPFYNQTLSRLHPLEGSQVVANISTVALIIDISHNHHGVRRMFILRKVDASSGFHADEAWLIVAVP